MKKFLLLLALTTLVGCMPKLPEIPEVPELPELEVPEIKTPKIKEIEAIPFDPSVRAIDGIDISLGGNVYECIAGKVENSPGRVRLEIYSSLSGIRVLDDTDINIWTGLEPC